MNFEIRKRFDRMLRRRIPKTTRYPDGTVSRRKLLKVIPVQETCNNILRAEDVGGGMDGTPALDIQVWRGNRYTSRRQAVTALRKKRLMKANYGIGMTNMAVTKRAAMALPTGLSLMVSKGKKADAKDEYDFLQELVDLNNLNEGGTTELARELEYEGSEAERLVWSEPLANVLLKHIPWNDTCYDAHPDDENFTMPGDLTYKDGDTTVRIPAQENVLIATGTQRQCWDGMPALAYAQQRAEAMDESLIHWHIYVDLFGHVFPYLNAESEDDAKQFIAFAEGNLWKQGSAFASRGDMSFIEPTGKAAEVIENEITMNLKFFSAETEIPPQWMGFPDLPNAKATAQAMGEAGEVISLSTISAWKAFFEQLFDKSINMRNEHLHRPLRTGLIKPKLLPISDRQWNNLVKFWLPLSKMRPDLVPNRLFWSKIPDADPEEIEEMVARDREDDVAGLLSDSGAEVPGDVQETFARDYAASFVRNWRSGARP